MKAQHFVNVRVFLHAVPQTETFSCFHLLRLENLNLLDELWGRIPTYCRGCLLTTLGGPTGQPTDVDPYLLLTITPLWYTPTIYPIVLYTLQILRLNVNTSACVWADRTMEGTRNRLWILFFSHEWMQVPAVCSYRRLASTQPISQSSVCPPESARKTGSRKHDRGGRLGLGPGTGPWKGLDLVQMTAWNRAWDRLWERFWNRFWDRAWTWCKWRPGSKG